LNYYDEKGLLVKIVGEQSIDDVTADLTAVVKDVM